MSKVWFVTGSARGLGRRIIETVLASGDCVIATARDPSQLEGLVTTFGDRVLPLALDVTDEQAVYAAVEKGLDKFGRFDVVVNNAGYGTLAAIEDIDRDEFHRQMNTNFFGVVNVTKAVLPTLREQGFGHIFQVSSLGGRLGTPGLGAYQSAKWAVNGFSTVLALEVAPLGIQVTVLEPGGIRTDWAGASMAIPPISPSYASTVGQVAEFLRDNTGAEPTSPEAIAKVMVSLANKEDAPLRLLLGKDAVTHAAQAASALETSDAHWRYLSESISSDQ